MHLTNQHRALLITFLISGTVLLLIFNIGLKEREETISESYYELVQKKEKNKEDIKAPDKSFDNKLKTNKVFNENEKVKQFAQAYKAIEPPKDYVPKINHSSESRNATSTGFKSFEHSQLDDDELSKFNKANEILKKQLAGGNDAKSSISFSLINRTKVFIPIPVYLCEVDGKIVVNIMVNSKGEVTDTYLNTTSDSSNECLIDHALEYAKQSLFSVDPKKASQVGSITFHFIGKN